MLDTSHSAATTVARWRAAAEGADAGAALACLSPDIVLNSPLTEQFRLTSLVTGEGGTVSFTENGTSFEASGDKPILEQAEEANAREADGASA